jgi:hypothetical protein
MPFVDGATTLVVVVETVVVGELVDVGELVVVVGRVVVVVRITVVVVRGRCWVDLVTCGARFS